MQMSQYHALSMSFIHKLHYVIFERFSKQWRWSLSLWWALLSASEECTTSTSSTPANSNSCSSNFHLNMFLKMELNWPVFEGYPVLKQQMEVYKNGPENNRIQQTSDTLASVGLRWYLVIRSIFKTSISLPMSVIHAFFFITLLLWQFTCDTIISTICM